jgi:hypothetical protein
MSSEKSKKSKDIVNPPIAPQKRLTKDSDHYVDNKKFLAEMVIWKRQIREAEEVEDDKPPVSTYIGECFMKIAERLSSKHNFANYPYREEMVGDAIENCLMYAHNFNPKYGNSVRQWMQKNAEGIRQVTRKRQMDSLGGAFFSSTYVPPGSVVQKCTEYECTMMPTNDRKGIGLVRTERVPPLFGTYDPTAWAPAETNTALTTVFEGGRNTPRGREFNVLGGNYVHATDGKRGIQGKINE